MKPHPVRVSSVRSSNGAPRGGPWGRAVAATLLLGTVLAPAVHAQDKVDFDAEALFTSSCAPCHGLRGAGDGPVSGALNPKPKPLSNLAAAHGGKFPADYVFSTIDGRISVDAHGPRNMPVWGRYFVLKQKSGDGSKPSLQARESNSATIITALVEYVRSLQAVP